MRLPPLPLGLGDMRTSPDLHLPDIGPGMEQERDKALDADAQGPLRPTEQADGPTRSEQQAAVDLDASIEDARERAGVGGPPAAG